MKQSIVVWKAIARYAASLLFLISSISKMLDIFRTAYKVSEYMQTFHIQFSYHILIFISILLIEVELLISIALAFEYKVKYTCRFAIALVIFFMMLTTYSVKFGSMVSCGCLGEILHLNYEQTFIKNLALLVLLITNINNPIHHIHQYLRAKKIIYIVIISIVLFPIVSLRLQPLYDFSINPVGNKLINRINEYTVPIEYEILHHQSKETETTNILNSDDKVLVAVVNDTNAIKSKRFRDFIDNSQRMAKETRHSILLISNKKAIEMMGHTCGNTPIGLADEGFLRDIISSPTGLFLLEKGVIVAKWYSSPFSYNKLPQELSELYTMRQPKSRKRVGNI